MFAQQAAVEHVTRTARAGSTAARRRIESALVGAGARSVVVDPVVWADVGSAAECLQYLKLLWHVLVISGRPHAELA